MAKDKEEPQEEVQDEMTVLLQQAAEQLSKAATDRENRSESLKAVEATLSKIKLVDFPDLAESPVVQAFVKAMGMDDLKPGEIKNRGTVAEREREWTVDDMYREFEHITFLPNHSAPYTWNGVGPFYLKADEEITVPKPIYDRYREVLFARRQAAIHEAYLMGKSDQPPHPDWITDEGASVRGWSLQGEAFGGRRGGHISTGLLNMNEEAQ